MEAKVIDLTDIDVTFPTQLPIEIKRDNIIDTIKRMFDSGIDVIFVEGDTGCGKTTIISQHSKINPFNSISHFIDNADRYTYDYDAVKKNIYDQLYFFINNKINEKDFDSNNTIFQLRPHIDKKIKKDKTTVYFSFDGLDKINSNNLELIKTLISELPWGKVKFLISGDSEKVKSILPDSKSIKYKSIPLPYFSLQETRIFLSDLTSDEEQILEIYKISLKGSPRRLSQVKRLCQIHGIKKFLSDEDIDDKTDLVAKEWENIVIQENDKLLLSLLAFDDYKYTLESLAVRLNLCVEDIQNIVNKFSFLTETDSVISFISDDFRKYVIHKFSALKEKVLMIAINYFLENPNDEESIINLPYLYKKANKYKELVNSLSLTSFVILFEKNQSLATINQQFEYGLSASKEIDKNSATYLRFALPKASFKEVERHSTFENEIEARIALNEHERAYELACKVFAKEDRIRALAILARVKIENNLTIEPIIIEQIKELFSQIKINLLGEMAINLASDLLYSCPDLAIDLIDHINSDKTDSQSDRGYEYLSLNAIEAKLKVNHLTDEIDKITSKIKDDDKKNLITAYNGLVDGYDADQIIRKASSLSTINKQLFLLKNWIIENKALEQVSQVIEHTLNIIITSSSEDVPSASVLKDIAIPLPEIKDIEKARLLIKLFDSQKNTINSPTKDFVKLQLIIATTELNFDYSNAKDRFFDLYTLVDDITDVSLKADCFATYWADLMKLENKNEIEDDEKLISLVKLKLDENVIQLLKDTADHEELMEYILKKIVNIDGDLALDYISDINTRYRRNIAYYTILKSYLAKKNLSSVDFTYLKKVYDLITEVEIKNNALYKIVNNFSNIEINDLANLEKLIPYLNSVCDIEHVELKCLSICNSLLILNLDPTKKSLYDRLLRNLESTWEHYDLSWRKVEIGFIIAKKLADKLPELARQYLDKAVYKKENNNFLESTSITDTYIQSIRLSIRAFSGVVRKGKDIEDEIKVIGDAIKVIPSQGEQVRLWCECALRLYSKGNNDHFKKIMKDYVKPGLLRLNLDDKDYTYFVIQDISPALFIDHQQSFYEFLSDFSDVQKDYTIHFVSKYIMTKLLISEPVDFSLQGYQITHEEAKDICGLMDNMVEDTKLFLVLTNLIKCLKHHKLVQQQMNDIKRRINNIITTKLPNTKIGVRHNGYLIASKAILQSLEIYNETAWKTLKLEADSIPNYSDRVFVYCVIAEEINSNKAKKHKLDILLEAYSISQNIPSNYDKFERYDKILKLLSEVSKTEFLKIYTEIVLSLSLQEDQRLYGKRKVLIDLLYQQDPDNINKYLSIFDDDIIRRRNSKDLINKRVDQLKRSSKALEEYSSIDLMRDPREINEFAHKTLSQLNGNRITSKNAVEAYYIIEAASNYALSDSYYLFALYIENLVKKLGNSDASVNVNLLKSIFDATIFNTHLIDILSQNTTAKLKNRLVAINSPLVESKMFFSIGEREKAEKFIKSWLEENLDKKLTIIDPYFSESDLSILSVLKEINSSCEIIVLTSKEGGKNIYDNNKEVYKSAWRQLSDEKPPFTKIIVTWTEGSKKSPSHDRWWIPDDAETGLYFGSSYNSLGLSKDSSVVILNENEAKNIQNSKIRDYLNGDAQYYGNSRLLSESFYINFD